MKTWIWFLASIAVSAPLVGATQKSTHTDREVRVLRIEGDVMRSSSAGEVRLKPGDSLEAGARIRVSSPSGRAVLKLGTATVVSLDPGADAKLETRKGGDWTLDLTQGGVLSVVRNPKKRPDRFQVRTKTAVLGVRGTVFYVNADPARSTRVCTCKGTVRTTSPEGNLIRELTSKHHDFPYDVAAPQVLSPMEGSHSDPQIAELEALLTQK